MQKTAKGSWKHTRAVSFAVAVQSRLDSELTTTQFTAERLFASMNANMSNQITRLPEVFTTRCTSVVILPTTTATSL